MPIVNVLAEILAALKVLNAAETVINVAVESVVVLRISIVAVLARMYCVDRFSTRSKNDDVFTVFVVNVLTEISVV